MDNMLYNVLLIDGDNKDTLLNVLEKLTLLYKQNFNDDIEIINITEDNFKPQDNKITEGLKIYVNLTNNLQHYFKTDIKSLRIYINYDNPKRTLFDFFDFEISKDFNDPRFLPKTNSLIAWQIFKIIEIHVYSRQTL